MKELIKDLNRLRKELPNCDHFELCKGGQLVWTMELDDKRKQALEIYFKKLIDLLGE